MSERFLFVTGHLAFPRLERLLRSQGETPFIWEIWNIGVKVAALMTDPAAPPIVRGACGRPTCSWAGGADRRSIIGER